MSRTKQRIPEATRRAVARRYGCEPGRTLVGVPCFWCGAEGSIVWNRLASGRPSAWVTFPGLELDHFLPEFHGGSAQPENIILACRPCNRSRGSRLPHVFLSEEHVLPHCRKGTGKGTGNREGIPPRPSLYLTRRAPSAIGLGR